MDKITSLESKLEQLLDELADYQYLMDSEGYDFSSLIIQYKHDISNLEKEISKLKK